MLLVMFALCKAIHFLYMATFCITNGNSKLARLRHNVRMENRTTVLTTDSLNYDRSADLAYYYTGGKIVDKENTLTSIWGQFSPSTNDALFRNKVHLINKDFSMDSDTMKYNTKTNISNIVGPHIIYQDETDIHSSLRLVQHNIGANDAFKPFKDFAQDGKTLTGDTVFYDKTKKFGEAFVNVILNDTVQKTTLYGDYVYYNELNESGLAADSALL